MRTLFVCFVLFTVCPLLGKAQKLLADTAGGYKLAWADEFNKDGAPDTTNWKFEKGFVRNHEAQWYQPQNASCKNGILIIEANKEHIPNPNYTAGRDNY